MMFGYTHDILYLYGLLTLVIGYVYALITISARANSAYERGSFATFFAFAWVAFGLALVGFGAVADLISIAGG